MTLIEYFLQYLTRLCEGVMMPPKGLSLTAQDEQSRAAELQTQIAAMGIPAFVRLCADAQGEQLPQQVYDDFRTQDFLQAMQAVQPQTPVDEPLVDAPAQEQPVDVPAQEQPVNAPADETPAEKQNAYEAFLDCICLDDNLLDYLIEVLKTADAQAFFRLAQVSVRMPLAMEDFLYWFSTKELYADTDERACATIMDACLTRLADEGQLTLLAALLCADRKTFELLRCDAPELRQLPAATYEWFEEYYVNRYYPIRFVMKHRGVNFPQFSPEERV